MGIQHLLKGIAYAVAVAAFAGLAGLALYVGTADVGAANRLAPIFRSPFVLSSHAPEGPITNIYGGPGSDSNADVATDAKGNWLAVWHSTDSLGERIGADWDILIARSSDNGATWSDHAALNTNAATDAGRDLSPTIATDGKSVWLVAWVSTETFGGAYGLDRDILVSRSSDAGATWSPPSALNINADRDWGDDWAVSIATDRKGNWAAVWSSTESLGARVGGDSDIFVARSNDDAVTWTHPMPLNTNAATDKGFDASPDIVTDGSGRWLVAWSSGDTGGGRLGTDRDILIARSDDDCRTWSAPSPLNSNATSDANSDWMPSLATDGQGAWLAVWSSAVTFDGEIGFDRDILVARSMNNGNSWSQAEPLNTNAGSDTREDSAPELVTDGAGRWVVVWHSWGGLSYTDGSDADIVVSYSANNGRDWSEPMLINRAGTKDTVDDLLPGLATDAAGHMVAVWQSFYPATGAVASAEWRVIASAGAIEEVVGPSRAAN